MQKIFAVVGERQRRTAVLWLGAKLLFRSSNENWVTASITVRQNVKGGKFVKDVSNED